MSRSERSTRTRILDAALTLLADSDGTGVRMSDIARAAGVSRQAVYLHFANRADLLTAATLRLDEVKDSDARLAASRAATSGEARLAAFIEAWSGYLPEIYPIARALLAMRDEDAEARAAWDKRMRDMREGCEAAVVALERDGTLNPVFEPEAAVDLLWTLLSVRNWEHLTQTCGWSQEAYRDGIAGLARESLVRGRG